MSPRSAVISQDSQKSCNKIQNSSCYRDFLLLVLKGHLP